MSQEFDRLVEIVARLRAPEGCPWDRQQTHDTLRPYLLEETYEVFDALDAQDSALLREELGDVLLQVLLHAQLAAEAHKFTIEEVTTELTNKLIRRHPHVFEPAQSEAPSLSPEQVHSQWEAIKQTEKPASTSKPSQLSGIPTGLPALFRAWKIQSRASRVGFDWPSVQEVIDKLDEELQELRDVVKAQDSQRNSSTGQNTSDRLESEFGDVLFTIANLARFLHINPEEALRKATNRFVTRFHHLESKADSVHKKPQEITAAEWDQWWEEAKQVERNESPS